MRDLTYGEYHEHVVRPRRTPGQRATERQLLRGHRAMRLSDARLDPSWSLDQKQDVATLLAGLGRSTYASERMARRRAARTDRLLGDGGNTGLSVFAVSADDGQPRQTEDFLTVRDASGARTIVVSSARHLPPAPTVADTTRRRGRPKGTRAAA